MAQEYVFDWDKPNLFLLRTNIKINTRQFLNICIYMHLRISLGREIRILMPKRQSPKLYR